MDAYTSAGLGAVDRFVDLTTHHSLYDLNAVYIDLGSCSRSCFHFAVCSQLVSEGLLLCGSLDCIKNEHWHRHYDINGSGII